jgi:pimeloyl-ACP methyl ester carboxylesterase
LNWLQKLQYNNAVMGSVYYKQQGDGPALVFLHGFCESHEIWDETGPELSSDYRVITPDLPGFGKSAILKSPFSIREVGRTVIEFIETLGIRKLALIGHSLGGYVALAIAKERPDLVAGLCLFHSTAQADSEEKRINRNKVIYFVERNGVQPFIETFVPGLFFQREVKKIKKVHKIASGT